MSKSKPITVNVDEWMESGNSGEKLQPAIEIPGYAESLTDEDRAKIEKRRADMAKAMNRMEEIAAREGKLDDDPRDCDECGEHEAHYKGDYICYHCRDKRKE